MFSESVRNYIAKPYTKLVYRFGSTAPADYAVKSHRGGSVSSRSFSVYLSLGCSVCGGGNSRARFWILIVSIHCAGGMGFSVLIFQMDLRCRSGISSFMGHCVLSVVFRLSFSMDSDKRISTKDIPEEEERHVLVRINSEMGIDISIAVPIKESERKGRKVVINTNDIKRRADYHQYTAQKLNALHQKKVSFLR